MTTETIETNANPSAEATALADLQRDNADLLKKYNEQRGLTAAAIGERDTFKARADQLAPKATRHDELVLQVEALTNEKREAAILDHVRQAIPHAEPAVLRGVMTQFHEAKKVNRFAGDAKAEADKFIEAAKAEAPSILARPTSGGGSPDARGKDAAPVKKTKFLI